MVSQTVQHTEMGGNSRDAKVKVKAYFFKQVTHEGWLAYRQQNVRQLLQSA